LRTRVGIGGRFQAAGKSDRLPGVKRTTGPAIGLGMSLVLKPPHSSGAAALCARPSTRELRSAAPAARKGGRRTVGHVDAPSTGKKIPRGLPGAGLV
jgi:hypothetical protein